MSDPLTGLAVRPDPTAFVEGLRAGAPQAMWTTLNADLDTPVSAMLKIGLRSPYGFLLESVEGGVARGRYSFIGLEPDLIWRCVAGSAEIARAPRGDPTFEPCPVGSAQGALASLRALIAESKVELPDGLPPMSSGLVGYMGYDMIRLVERLPAPGPDPLGVPDAIFARPSVVAVFDNLASLISIVTTARPDPGVDPAAAFDAARARLAAVVDALRAPLPPAEPAVAPAAPAPLPASNMTPEAYCALVEAAKAYIRAGDIFQVVLSQRFSTPFSQPPFSLYRALRRVNPSPFLFFLDFDGFAVIGSSPEIMVRVRHGKVTIRPIAGTRPRAATEEENRALATELLADPKERAEHLMLLDLGRNDVGRVARVGTVEVTEKMIIEQYSHVMHIVSNVEGELDAGRCDALDALFSGFPAGTVTGAPKVRAMEIIDELETLKRGVYGGCIGYFSADGELDTCIALRTGVLKDGVLHVQAGGGLVYDSDPMSEHRECQNKAKALLRAAEEARGFA